jgi:hypothetical protein
MCSHGRPASCLPKVVLGDLEIVAANGFDRASDRGPVDQVHPDRFTSPGMLWRASVAGTGGRPWPGVGRSRAGSPRRATEAGP